jgi:Zn-dependent alcohol dehydrogenases, class III
MALQYRAAVLHAAQTPLSIETVTAAALKPTDVLVRIRAAGLCHTDLEVIEGSLRYPLPMVLGHEAAGIVEQVGSAARDVQAGDHVVLSWNPHCGQCFYCDRDAPILCEQYLGEGPKGTSFDGEGRTQLADGRALQQLMFLGSFGEYWHRLRSAGYSCTEGDSVRPGLPARLRRHDGRGSSAQPWRHRPWRYCDGHRMRRCGPCRRAGRATRRGRRDYRRRH